ncbi:MAG: hypothetical protein AAF841_06695 [Pseudomonadota bacterium]
MSDGVERITEYEARLVAALGRIEKGLAAWPDQAEPVELASPADQPAPAPAAEIEAGKLAALKEQLEEERTANAQLQQRVRQIRRKQDDRVAKLEGELKAMQDRYEEVAREAVKLRRAEGGLRQALSDLQAGAAENAVDAHLINRAMMAELEALRAERTAEAREVAEVIAAIEPLVEEGSANA